MRVLLDAVESAMHDGRTGLLTRDAWSSRAAAALKTEAGGRPGLLLIDIDHFKSWNDRLGHPVGDKVLAAVAWAARCELRHVDLVGRYGGDELAVLLADQRDEASVVAVADRVRRRVTRVQVAATSSGPGGGAGLSVSIGACLAPRDPTTACLDDLIIAADRALYAAKEAGRDTVRLAGTDVVDGDDDPNSDRRRK